MFSAPSDKLYLPAGQFVQGAFPVPPVLYVPVGHIWAKAVEEKSKREINKESDARIFMSET